jgi:PAS domain S-box-containing protein
VRYAIALAACAFLLLFRLMTWSVIQQELPFILFLPAILFSAWYGGTGPGLLATFLTATAILYFDLGNADSFNSVTKAEVIGLALYTLAGVALSFWRSAHLASTRTFQDLVEALPDGLVAVDRKGTIVQVNSQAERMFGYSRKELLHQHVEMLVPEDLRSGHEAWRDLYGRHPTRRPMGTDLAPYARRKDGSTLAVEVSLSPVSAGHRPLVVSIIRDVTQRRQFEATLRALNDRLAQLVENSPTPVAVLDANMRYLHTSRSWLPAHGLPENQDIVGVSHYDIHSDLPERWKEIHRRCLAGAVERCDEDQYRHEDGTVDWLKWEVHPWRDPNGNVGGLVIYSENITESRATAAALREALGARDAFISAASHELRNPLSALAMQVALLRWQVEGSDERLTNRIDGMNRQIVRLTKLIDNLLDVSRITTGKLNLEIEDVDLSEVAIDVVERSSDELAKAACPITVDAAAPAVGRFDRFRLDQIITNLLSNAMKYGKGKPIELRIAGDEEKIELAIHDGGVGIAPADQQRIFERFERASSTSVFPGIGLGLWIVRQIVDAMGGTIGVTSRPGEGSTFRVTLPRTGAATALA